MYIYLKLGHLDELINVIKEIQYGTLYILSNIYAVKCSKMQ